MKLFCSVCLGNFMQSVTFIDEKGMVKVEKVPIYDLPTFFAKHADVEEIRLLGADKYIEKLIEETKAKMPETKMVPVKFVIEK